MWVITVAITVTTVEATCGLWGDNLLVLRVESKRAVARAAERARAATSSWRSGSQREQHEEVPVKLLESQNEHHRAPNS